MPLDNDYAWMAAAAYNLSRNPANQVAAPAGWKELQDLSTKNTTTGFAAVVFQNIATGETVISYRGTDSGPGLLRESSTDFEEAATFETMEH
jgi:hypothetical protein